MRDQTRLPRDDANFPFYSPSKSMSFVFAKSENDHDSDNGYEGLKDSVTRSFFLLEWRPFDFVLRALRPLRPRDNRKYLLDSVSDVG